MRVSSIRTLAIAALTMVVSATLTVTPAKASSSLENRTVTPIAAGAQVTCEVTPAPNQGAIIIRDGPSTSSSYWGTLYPGEFVGSACSGASGGSYSACGGGNSWIEVFPPNSLFSRYMARRCVTLYRWS